MKEKVIDILIGHGVDLKQKMTPYKYNVCKAILKEHNNIDIPIDELTEIIDDYKGIIKKSDNKSIDVLDDINKIIEEDDNIPKSDWENYKEWKFNDAIWDTDKDGAKTKLSDCYMNIIEWLDHYPKTKCKLKQNDITMRLMYEGKEMKNIESDMLKMYCTSFMPKFSKPKLFHDAIVHYCLNNTVNPVIEYFNQLGEWDKKDDALKESLIDMFKINEDDEYFELYYEELKKTLVASIARMFKPGIKFDQILVFCSKNGGTGKSTFIKELSRINDMMYCVEKNSRQLNFGNKDTLMEMHTSWFFSLDEIDVRRDIVTTMKTMLQQEEDIFRKPYGYDAESYKRKFIFVGTSNNDDFLKDYTSMYERRWWIIKVTEDIKNGEYIKNRFETTDIRDRIWRQVYHMYKEGNVNLWMDDANLKDKLYKLQQGYKYVSNDEYEDVKSILEIKYYFYKDGTLDSESMLAQLKYNDSEFKDYWKELSKSKTGVKEIEFKTRNKIDRIPKNILVEVANKSGYEITKKGLDLALSEAWNKKSAWYNGRTQKCYVRKSSDLFA